jgi:hypothetical protein
MSRSQGSCTALASGHSSPDEADEFAGHGRHRNRAALPVPHQMTVASVQALLSLPRLAQNRSRLARAPSGEGPGDGRAMPVVPSRLDEDPSSVAVAGLGERASTLARS